MNHLWAPWRMSYVSGTQRPAGCVFCALAGEQPGLESGLLARAELNFVVLNAFPYNTGHLMVVPCRHEGDFTALPAATGREMLALSQLAVQALQETFHAEGANVGMNIGKPAGAGIQDHLHLHVVPRWGGDANFMTTTAQTRIVPQSLEDTWGQLAPVLQRLVAERLHGLLDGGG